MFVISAFVQPYYLKRHMKSHKEYRYNYVDDRTLEHATLVGDDEHAGSDQQCGIRKASCHLCSATCKGQEELDLHFSKHHVE